MPVITLPDGAKRTYDAPVAGTRVTTDIGPRLAKDALDLGFYLSFSGVLTFKNATMLRDIAKTVPLDRLMVETDCPYLAPVPHRGRRNEPSYLVNTAEAVARHRAVSVDELAQTTTRNANKVFQIH